MRRLAAVGLVATLALAGCTSTNGDIKISKKKTTTTTEAPEVGGDAEANLASALQTSPTGDDFMSSDEADCVAGSVVSELSEDGLQIATDSEAFDATEYSSRDTGAFEDAITDCIDSSDMTSQFVDGMLEGGDLPISRDDATCAAEEIIAQYDNVGEFLISLSSADQEELGALFFESFAGCASQESASGFVPAALNEAGLGLNEEQSGCLANEIVTSLGVQRTLELFAAGSEQSGSELETAMATGAITCNIDTASLGDTSGGGGTDIGAGIGGA